MAVEYERKNRIDGQDNRRIIFAKMLEYWDVVGEEFVNYERKKINEIIIKSPFVD
jgi:hypothetical protein